MLKIRKSTPQNKNLFWTKFKHFTTEDDILSYPKKP